MPQAQRAGYETQHERFKSLEFSPRQWEEIIQTCNRAKIDFLTTCFDADLMASFAKRQKFIKIASGDLTYFKLLRAASNTGKRVLLSTGMGSYKEIEEAVWHLDKHNVTVMHCVSSYPTPDIHANMNVIRKLQETYQSVGYSDHTEGITACLIAASLGCEVIEKHFTHDNTLDYGDHPVSVTADEMAVLVEQVRRISTMLGSDKPADIELNNRKVLRRGAYAARPITIGKPISEADIIELRPATRRKPHELIGKRARRTYQPLEPIDA
jgi:N,N'-diacetyllegionaminate synthase